MGMLGIASTQGICIPFCRESCMKVTYHFKFSKMCLWKTLKNYTALASKFLVASISCIHSCKPVIHVPCLYVFFQKTLLGSHGWWKIVQFFRVKGDWVYLSALVCSTCMHHMCLACMCLASWCHGTFRGKAHALSSGFTSLRKCHYCSSEVSSHTCFCDCRVCASVQCACMCLYI